MLEDGRRSRFTAFCVLEKLRELVLRDADGAATIPEAVVGKFAFGTKGIDKGRTALQPARYLIDGEHGVTEKVFSWTILPWPYFRANAHVPFSPRVGPRRR